MHYNQIRAIEVDGYLMTAHSVKTAALTAQFERSLGAPPPLLKLQCRRPLHRRASSRHHATCRSFHTGGGARGGACDERDECARARQVRSWLLQGSLDHGSPQAARIPGRLPRQESRSGAR
jgi:hypothetical protein